DDLVADVLVVSGRPEVLPDAFDQVGASLATGVDRTLRVRPDDPHPPVGDLLQVTADPRDGSSGADAGHEVGDAPLGLPPDLRTGDPVVRLGVVQVGVLVRLPRPVDLLHQAVGDPVVGVRVVGRHRGRAHHDFRAVRLEDVPLVLADLVRAHEDAPVALALGDHRQPHPGVPGGRFDDGPAGAQLAGRFGGLDHAQRDAVLHTATRVEVLHLGQHRGR